MAEIERTRERERPPLQDNPYERTLKYRKEQRERNRYTEYDPVLGWRKTPGAAVVYDKVGERAGMYVEEGTGHVVAYNKQALPVAMLTEGKTAGGLFVLTNSSGERMVAAGVQPEGFGVVQAGPASFMQAAGLGLPGSYIAGKAK